MTDRKEFLEQLAKAGAQWGHVSDAWNPKMAPYIWGVKNGVHLIDIGKTEYQVRKAAKFLHDVAAQGKTILWIGTKKAAQETINAIGKRLDMPFISHRWVGGTLSNYGQVKKSVTKLLHFEDVLSKSDKFPHYTKKELNTISKITDRLRKNVGGITQLSWPIGAIVVVDVNKERSAVKEAARMGVPVVALVDTNASPSQVDFVIPANDDAPRAIKLLLDVMADAAEQGKVLAGQKKAEVAVELSLDEEGRTALDLLEEEEAGEKQRKEDRKEGSTRISAARRPAVRENEASDRRTSRGRAGTPRKRAT